MVAREEIDRVMPMLDDDDLVVVRFFYPCPKSDKNTFNEDVFCNRIRYRHLPCKAILKRLQTLGILESRPNNCWRITPLGKGVEYRVRDQHLHDVSTDFQLSRILKHG